MPPEDSLSPPRGVVQLCGCYTSTHDGITDHYVCAEHRPASAWEGQGPGPYYLGSFVTRPLDGQVH